MKKFHWGYLWILPFLFFLVPTIYATGVGFYMIYQDWKQIFIFILLGIFCSVLTWLLSVWWMKRRLRFLDIRLKEKEYWSHLERAAAAEVEAYVRETEVEHLDITKTQTLMPHLMEILRRVAKVYHPQQKSPELDIPVSDVLLIAQRVTDDLRIFINENVPGSHLLTLHDIRTIHSAVSWSRPAYNAYRVVSVPINPISAFFRETQAYFTRKFTQSLTKQIRETLVHYVFRQVGYYAVELYSGRLRMEYLQQTGQWESVTEKRGDLARLKEDQTASAEADADSRRLTQEPLRVLVVGQGKSGKTSLVRTLFRLPSALPDPVSREAGIPRYLIPFGEEKVLVSDSAGYDIRNSAGKSLFGFSAAEKVSSFEILRPEVEQSDVIFLVCDLNTAAREADRQFVDGLRAWAEAHPEKTHPLLVVVMTGIDRLRPFLDWNPPFNVKTPATEKERNIREAVQTLTTTLDLDESIPVVPVCLTPERLHNVEESLRPILADLFSQAICVRDSRSLEGLAGRRWRETGQQILNIGGKIWKHFWK